VIAPSAARDQPIPGRRSSDHPTRRRLLSTLADRIVAGGATRIGVDGVDGAGKTCFAEELTAHLQSYDHPVVHVSADGFHQPRARRYRRGRDSPEGFWLDSYDYTALKTVLLEGFGPNGTGRYRDAVHDLATDERLERPWRKVAAGTRLVVDGLFLHRDELLAQWDFSVFLAVPFSVSMARMAARDGGHPDPDHPSNHRYVGGQRRYFTACEPWARATLVVDNSDLEHPRIVAG